MNALKNQVKVQLTDSQLEWLDAEIKRGTFRNRSEALRAGLRLILRDEQADKPASHSPR